MVNPQGISIVFSRSPHGLSNSILVEIILVRKKKKVRFLVRKVAYDSLRSSTYKRTNEQFEMEYWSNEVLKGNYYLIQKHEYCAKNEEINEIMLQQNE